MDNLTEMDEYFVETVYFNKKAITWDYVEYIVSNE